MGAESSSTNSSSGVQGRLERLLQWHLWGCKDGGFVLGGVGNKHCASSGAYAGGCVCVPKGAIK